MGVDGHQHGYQLQQTKQWPDTDRDWESITAGQGKGPSRLPAMSKELRELR
jgi:hypothetical protein